MLLLLTESFSKLSTALTEKSSDSKADWPKFSGDSKKFRLWYLAIMSQLSLAPWLELYDPILNDVVPSTTNSNLNEKLFSKLILALEGTALQNAVARKHLRANGLLLLQDLVQTYKPRNVPEVIAAKTGEFWSNTKRFPSESVDTYYNRFHELLEDLADAEEPISTNSAIRHFIFTLGPEFESFQHNYRIGNLPDRWKTQDWLSLLVLCRDYYNSIKPTISTGRRPPPPADNSTTFDKVAHQKKLYEWFLSPIQFCKEIEAEQRLHPNKCIYHLSKTHTTENCAVKKECDRFVASKSTSPQPSSLVTSGQLPHITEEVFIDSVQDDCQVDFDMPNDTNQDVLNYFARVTNHYLRLARSSAVSNLREIPRHTRKYPIIADSGANWHMFKEKEFFTSLNPSQGHVVLGDGKMSLSIHGIGTVTCKIGQHILTIEDVRYVPGLSESIFSLFRHIQEPQHSLQSSFEDGLSLIFPEFTSKAVLGHHDIYLDAEPIIDPDNFSSVDVSTDQFCRNLKEFTNDVTKETKYLDNLLKNLRQYYKEAKTKRQLNLDVPAGFRRATTQQRQLRDFWHSQLKYPSVECDSTLPSEPSLLSQVSDTLPNPLCHGWFNQPLILPPPTQIHLLLFPYLFYDVWIKYPHLYRLG
jgi:hypothetical protein